MAVAVALGLVLASCGSDDDTTAEAVDDEPSSSIADDLSGFQPVSIDNCGERIMFDAPPERAVPLDQNVTEMPLVLGVEDGIAAYAQQHFNPAQPVLPEFQTEYDALDRLADTSPAREVFLEAEPDFTLAAFAFGDDSGLSREQLIDDGIPTYLLPDQCPGRTDPATFEDLYSTMRELGAIFGVPDRADALIEEWQATLDAVAEEVEGQDVPSVFIDDLWRGRSVYFRGHRSGECDHRSRRGREHLRRRAEAVPRRELGDGSGPEPGRDRDHGLLPRRRWRECRIQGGGGPRSSRIDDCDRARWHGASGDSGTGSASAHPRPSGGFDEWRRRRSAFTLVVVLFGALLVVSVVLAVGIGPASIRPGDVVRIVVSRATSMIPSPDGPVVNETIVFDFRLPRVLLGALVGAGLSVVGVVLQALVRNSLADPHIIGVSAGASVGATVVIVLGVNSFGIYSLSAAAFIGALVALVMVYLLAQQSGRLSPLRLILAGVAISYLFASVTSFMTFQADNASQVRSATFWLLGGLGAARWSYLALQAAAVMVGTMLLLLQSRRLDAIMMGDDTAASLGVDPSRFRKQLFAVAALIAGILIAVAGGIGFVALMIPHIARLLLGSSHRRLLPVAALGGAVFLVWADVGARMLLAPEELPIGIITAFCGAPFFLWLMRSRDSRVRVV